MPKKTATVYRDSRDGKFVKKSEVKSRPATTETEKRQRRK